MLDERSDAQAYLRMLIRDAVAERIEAGVTGIVVSGGLDSSTVAALSGDDLPTFTGYYEGGLPFDEREYANLVAGTRHTEIIIQPRDFVDNFDAMIQAVRPPFQGPGTFGQYMVGKAIKDNYPDLRVILSGEGADELFGGYARLMAVAGHPLPVGYEEYSPPDEYPWNIEEALAYDLERLPLLLAVDDQCMAAHGLEARAPFTDTAIVEFALELPPEERVGKHYLRQAVRGWVPDAIIDRTDKVGFASPLVAWANGPLRDFIGDRLGYIPDAGAPWARGWWLELCEKAHGSHLAALHASAA